MKNQAIALLCAGCLALSACAGPAASPETSSPAPTEAEAPQAMPIEYTDSGYTNAPIQADADMYAMDTVMHFRVYTENKTDAEKAINAAMDEIKRLDALLSTNHKDAELAILNSKGEVDLSDDSAYLYDRSREISKLTGGHFNVAIYPLVKAWGFTTQKFQVPDQATIDKLLPLTDMSLVHFDKDKKTIRFDKEGMGVDFGGIAKGYASQRIMQIFADNKVVGGLVNLGGNTQLFGTKPDGADFNVAIQDPKNEEDFVGIVQRSDCAIITSGIYQRYFEENGQRYHHIIDPATGKPADNSLASASVITADGTTADALATALMIMGKEGAIAFWQAHSDLFDMVLVDKDNRVSITPGLVEDFTTPDRPAPEVIPAHA
ncbi:FAD:protein FMN transferase [Peptococcus simiae]|uniref:FAD:protein FMN transferase n=1 Tax=Peptococcus simiae TaxID=1643805 RepID=A0ABW9GVJ7_9FIRM